MAYSENQNDRSSKYSKPAGALLGVGGAVGIKKSLPYITGRRSFWHGTSGEHAEKILSGQGIRPSGKTGAEGVLSSRKFGGEGYNFPQEWRKHAYISESPVKSGIYSVQSAMLTHTRPRLLRISARDWGGGKYGPKLTENPETAGGSQAMAKRLAKDYTGVAKRILEKDPEMVKSLHKIQSSGGEHAVPGISARRIVGAKGYQKLSAGEILKYARARPLRFLRGAGGAAVGAGAIIGGGALIRHKRPESRLASLLDDLINFEAPDPGAKGTSDSPFPMKLKWKPTPDELHTWNYNIDRKPKKKRISLKKVVGTQESVYDNIVDKYKKKKPRSLPEVSQYGDKYVIRDGHHRLVAEKRKGRKSAHVKVMQSDQEYLSSLLDDLIEFKLYQPKPGDEPPEELPVFKEGEVVDYNVQRHHAKRAGLHKDIRIGTPRHGLLSWVTRKHPPAHGEKVAVHPQSTHPHSYLGWSGDIAEGYGAGKVKSEDLGKALVTKSTPDELHATLADRKGSHRLAFIKTKSGWLHTKAKEPQPPEGASKPPAKSLSPKEAKGNLSNLEPGSSVQPKIDGALVYVTTKGGRPEIFSHRVSKTTGKHPIHTERVFRGRPTVDIPREHQRTLIGELYGKIRGKAIPPQDLGGLLNAHIHESIRKQRAAGVKLKVMPFDYVDGKDEQYAERLAKVKQTLEHLPKDVFHAPEEAKTPGDALRLHEKIRSGRHPLTKEGVIIHPPTGKMVKVKHTKEANVKIHSTFPGTGKFEDSHGGFYYSGKSGERLGKVGTGFTDETRRELHKYVGRTARVRYQEKFKSGKLRAPSFIAVDEGK